MTIISDIWAAIEQAEKLPFALELGVSGRHAFAADAKRIDTDGAREERRRLTVLRELKHVEAHRFDGWHLLFNDYPNPFARKGGRAAA